MKKQGFPSGNPSQKNKNYSGQVSVNSPTVANSKSNSSSKILLQTADVLPKNSEYSHKVVQIKESLGESLKRSYIFEKVQKILNLDTMNSQHKVVVPLICLPQALYLSIMRKISLLKLHL